MVICFVLQRLVYATQEGSISCFSIGSLDRDVVHRRPRLGISAVRHTHMAQLQSSTLPTPQSTPLVVREAEGEMNPLTIGAVPTIAAPAIAAPFRFRPGLRPVRLIDMAQFKVRRKQQLTKSMDPPMPKKQPLKAIQPYTVLRYVPNVRYCYINVQIQLLCGLITSRFESF